MKYLLRDFQKTHVSNLLKKLKQAKRDLLDDGALQAITLSAPTASGKTVMMTSLIERVLFGKGGLEEFDDPDFSTEPDAVFLWLSDSPQLNQQSLEKMRLAASGEVIGRLESVDATFDAEYFKPGFVYFLNSQKLSVAGLLTKKGDGRQFSIWETLNNTIARQKNRFYVVIDEAHRGMRRTRNEQTEAESIIQKFIFGTAGEVHASPIIIGISATPERFNTLLLSASRTRRAVDIPPNEPREAGLIKDCILISHADDDHRRTEWTLLAATCKEFRRISEEWEAYCMANNEEDIVRPVLVIQVEDAGAGGTENDSRTSLDRLVTIVREHALPGLTALSFAHCLESGKTLKVGDMDIRYVEPHRIEHDQLVRVVIFKMALTTGWDCPRAEVMMSFRKAIDATYIAQLVGRIVRTPLARRMEGNDLLNSVMLFLPYFDRNHVQTVVAKLLSEGESGGSETGAKSEFQTLKVDKDKQELLDMYRTLPTYATQGRKVTHIRRALRFALELARDGWEADARSVVDALRGTLIKIGDLRRKDVAFSSQVQGMSNVTYRMLRVVNGVLKPDDPGEQRSLSITEQDVETVFSRSFVTLTEELAMSYVGARYNEEDKNAVYWRCKLEAFLLSQDESVISAVETQAQKLIEETYEKRKPEIALLPTERRGAYRRIMQISRDFKATEPSVPEPLRLKTDKNAIVHANHLFVSEEGDFKASLNTWEALVLAAARKSPGFAGWLRNYPRKPWSIAYTYTNSEGQTAPGYPDFVVFRKDGKHISVDLLEPHQTGLSDSLAKAHGLSKFAENHGDRFGRIEWIKVKGSQIKRLNLNSAKVRAEVLKTKVDGAIDTLFDAFGSTETTPPTT